MLKVLELVKPAVLFFSLAVAAFIDWKKKKVYLPMIIATGCAGVIIHIFMQDMTIMDIIVGVLPGIILLFLGYVTKESIGYGDGCIFIMTGVYLGGLGNLMLLVISSVLAGIYAIVILLMRKGSRNDSFAYVPFVLFAYVVLII